MRAGPDVGTPRLRWGGCYTTSGLSGEIKVSLGRVAQEGIVIVKCYIGSVPYDAQ